MENIKVYCKNDHVFSIQYNGDMLFTFLDNNWIDLVKLAFSKINIKGSFNSSMLDIDSSTLKIENSHSLLAKGIIQELMLLDDVILK